jgi:serine/threonine protein kinase
MELEVPIASTSQQSKESQTFVNSPTTPRQLPSSGQRIGPYLLGKTLGVGSTGRVKLATHIESGQRVAIKIISKVLYFGSAKESKSQAALKLEREITIMKLIKQ